MAHTFSATPSPPSDSWAQPPPLDPRTARVLPWLVATAFFMQMLDATILNTALPAIADSLGSDPLRMHFVVIAYTLTVALLIPASGWVADRFGTRRVFFFAVLLFILGSLLCALSPSLEALVAARVVQGVGGALMVPVGRLTVLRAYPREQLLQVLSFVTIPALIGPLMGPILGGLLVQYTSWHWIFLMNIPVGLLGCLFILRWMPDIYGVTENRFDTRGFALISASIVLLSLGVEGIGDLNFNHGLVMALLMAGMVLMFGYWLLAMRSPAPIFSPKLFRTATFAVGIAGNLFSRLPSGALPFLTPLLLQVGLGFSPLNAGLSMTPLALAAIFSKYLVRRLVPALGYRRLLTGNTLFLGCLVMTLSLVAPDTPFLMIIFILTLIGASNSLHFSAMNTMTLLDLPDAQASSGNAMLSMVMQLSVSMGVAIAAALLQGFGERYSSASGQAAVLQAFSATFIWVSILAIISASIFLCVPRSSGLMAAPATE